MARQTVLILQPSLQPPGGGNGVCAWMLQALCDRYAVTVLSWEPVDLTAVDEYFGTSLRSSDVTFLVAAPRLRRWLGWVPFPLSTLKTSLLRRRAKRMRTAFDLLMTANNEADFGSPGVQYVHYPVRHVAPLAADLRWYHLRWVMSAYEKAWSLISPFDDDSMRSNLTLVNSAWTGRLVTAAHGVPVRVVHPPAPGTFEHTAWDDREDGFVCVGRLSPEKELEKVIEIVRRVRLHRPSVHLRLIGSEDDAAYTRRVRSVAHAAGPWVTLEGTLPIPALEQQLSRHRYFLHGMSQEHFGMAVAQAVRAGCLPFVPDDGGQVEIVGDEASLRYTSVDDAVRKIVALINDAPSRDAIRSRLEERAIHLTPERFMDDIRRAVGDAIVNATHRR